MKTTPKYDKHEDRIRPSRKRGFNLVMSEAKASLPNCHPPGSEDLSSSIGEAKASLPFLC